MPRQRSGLLFYERCSTITEAIDVVLVGEIMLVLVCVRLMFNAVVGRTWQRYRNRGRRPVITVCDT
jgi:hypothetical protein